MTGRLLCQSPHDAARCQYLSEACVSAFLCGLSFPSARLERAPRGPTALKSGGTSWRRWQRKVWAHLSFRHLGSCCSESVLLQSWTLPIHPRSGLFPSWHDELESTAMETEKRPGGRCFEKARGASPRARRWRASGRDGLGQSPFPPLPPPLVCVHGP